MSGNNRKRKTEPDPAGLPPDRLIPFLTAPGLSKRIARIAGVGGMGFLVSWYLSYLFLPEGFLMPAAGSGSAWAAGGALIAAAILAGNLLVRVKGLPLGYLAWAWGFLYYGVAAGTNSFLVPYSERITPTFRVFSRGMIYEMAAWAVLAAASCTWSLFEMETLGSSPRRAPTRTSRPELLAATGGALLLAAALVLEAAGILST